MVTIAEAFAIGLRHHQAAELQDAIRIYRQILDVDPNHADALHFLGLATSQTGDTQSAILLIRQSIALHPSKTLFHYNLGHIFQEQGMLAEAVGCYQRVLQFQPHDTATLNNFGRALHDLGKFDEAVACYQYVLRMNPGDAESHNNLGNALKELGKLDAAVACYQQALQIQPQCAAWHSNLGSAYEAQRNLDQAVACYEQALQINPEYAEAHYNLGNMLQGQGKLDAAVACYRRALQIRPQDAVTLNNLGNALKQQEKFDEAASCYQLALQFKPNDAKSHNNLGAVRQLQKRFDEAAQSYQRALECDPQYAEASLNLGNILFLLGKFSAAVSCYERVLQIQPENIDACINLGNTLKMQRRLDAAVACYRRVLQNNPDNALANFNLGTAFEVRKEFDDAVACYRRALQIKPDLSEARGSLVRQLQQLCEWDDVEDLSRQIAEAVDGDDDPETVPMIQPFAFVSLCMATTAAQQCRCARKWVQHHFGPMMNLAPTLGFNFSRPADNRIRIGYLSCDFRDHPVGLAICEVLEHHDHCEFEVTGYSIGPADSSATRQRLVKAFDRFVDIQTESYVESAKRIYADGIDILIDLMGHTGMSRTQILALQPAPIQVHYLGFPGTMGASFIQYIIGDEFVIPHEFEQFFTEHVVRLPGCFFPTDSHRVISSQEVSRASCGLPDDSFVFCCFNNSYKITPQFFSIWMRLLQAVPNSVLWLSAQRPSAALHLQKEATARGVSAERLVFAPKLPNRADHLARYGVADLFLDTFPYNAHSTACDALGVGCPVLTRSGETFASRVAGSLLHAVGLPELVTDSVAQYEDQALSLARNPVQLQRLRERLESSHRSSPLFDSRQLTRHLEQAYSSMWQHYLAGRLPQPNVGE